MFSKLKQNLHFVVNFIIGETIFLWCSGVMIKLIMLLPGYYNKKKHDNRFIVLFLILIFREIERGGGNVKLWWWQIRGKGAGRQRIASISCPKKRTPLIVIKI